MENSVELLGHYGGDRTHSLSAWTSTHRELTPEKIARIPKLLAMLKEGSHGEPHKTPFEKSALHFLVTSDIATHIHLIKHRIGVSVNAESARYKELNDDKFYIPEDWPLEWRMVLKDHAEKSFSLYHQCLKSLVDIYKLPKKRAKESARFFNPYATQIKCDIMFNFSSFIHFCNLRARDSAQEEVHWVAKEMIKQIMEIDGDPFHHSIEVWGLDKLRG